MAPGPGLAVEQMDSDLVVGVFSDGQDVDTGYLMVPSASLCPLSLALSRLSLGYHD